jgi:hypothetical protein
MLLPFHLGLPALVFIELFEVYSPFASVTVQTFLACTFDEPGSPAFDYRAAIPY